MRLRNNADRAADAGKAVKAHSGSTGLTEEDGAETQLGDLIANLRHWADVHKVDWDEVIRRSDYHYAAETAFTCPHCGARGCADDDWEGADESALFPEGCPVTCWKCREVFDLDKAKK